MFNNDYQKVFFLCRTDLDETALCCHLLGDLDGCLLVFRLLDSIVDFSQNQFDVRRLASVLSDPAVGTVRTAASRWGTVALGVADNELVSVKAFRFGVGNRVLQQRLVHTDGLDGPPSLVSGGVTLLGHTLASNTSSVLDEWDNCLECKDVVQHLEGLRRLHALGVMSNLTTVLVVHTKVRTTRLGSLFRDFSFH